jgi:hypothetical protein
MDQHITTIEAMLLPKPRLSSFLAKPEKRAAREATQRAFCDSLVHTLHCD